MSRRRSSPNDPDLRRHLDLGVQADLNRVDAQLLDGLFELHLAMLEGRQLHSLVIVLLMPLPGCDVGPTDAWDLDELQRLFGGARAMFPATPLLLGCARPVGRLQRKIDRMTVAKPKMDAAPKVAGRPE